MQAFGHPLGALLWATLTQPAETARVVLTQSLPRDALWSALALVSISVKE